VVEASNDNYVRNNARGYGASLLKSEVLSGRGVEPKEKKKSILMFRRKKRYPPR